MAGRDMDITAGRRDNDLFIKDGIESHNRGTQLRLLVHCEGCPPFLTVVAPDTTVGALKEQVQRQHQELFREGGHGDVPAVKVRWLEDSRRHALPLQSKVGELLADREKVYAVSRLDEPSRGLQGGTSSRPVADIVNGWRATCEQVAAELCAAAQSEDRRDELLDDGGLQCLLCVALHAGTIVPGDLSLAAVHEGLREMLKGEKSGRDIVEAGCDGQAVALLQAPDPDLQALGAFLCARMATDKRSHAVILSWGGCLRLAKALSLSSTSALRFDCATALRLLAENSASHSHICDPPVLRALREAIADASDAACQAKSAGTVLAMLRSGGEQVRDKARAGGLDAALAMCSERGGDSKARRVAGEALAALREGGGLSSLSHMPHVDEDLSVRMSLETPVLKHRNGQGVSLGEAAPGKGCKEGWVERMYASLLGGGDVGGQILQGIEGGKGGELLKGGQGVKLLSLLARSQAQVAASALVMLSKGGEAQRSAVVSEGGVPLAMMLTRSQDSSVQALGCEVLASLTLHKQLHRSLLQQGILPVLLSVVQSNAERSRVSCAKALSHLSSSSEVRRTILQDKGMARIVASLKGAEASDPFSAYIKLITS